MYKLNSDKVHKILVSELEFEPDEADLYLNHYPDLDDTLGKAVETWLKDRSILDIEIEGITIQQVMQNHNIHFLGAVKSLNGLLTRKLTSEQKEAIKTSLKNRPIHA